MAKAKKKKPRAATKALVAETKGVGNTYSIKEKKWSFEENPSEFGFDYTTRGPHCEVKRLKQGRCATQLNFIDGKPVLRLCGEYGEPGKIVAVSNPEDAQRKASRFCATKLGSRSTVEEDDQPEGPWGTPGLGETAEDAAVGSVQSLARAARGSSRPNARQARPLFNFGEASPQPARRAPKRNPSTEGLGSVNPSTWWLVGGTIAGVAVATLLKKSAAAPKA
jgi:hypothetical protein